jgi:MarR family transcriptional regulator, organic hydroperoxide resistance regulator
MPITRSPATSPKTTERSGDTRIEGAERSTGAKAGDSRYCKCMYFSAGALARRVEKLAARAWQPVGLSPSHAYLLMMAIDEPGIQPSDLSEELLLTPSTVTRLVEKLEEKKLVIRSNEGKTTKVFPTPKAKALRPQLLDCLKEFYESYSNILGKEESAKLVQAINKVTDRLKT